MKKYYIGSGYFHENKWVNGINMPTSAPTIFDDIIIDNRCSEIKFEFKNKLHRFIYNLKIAIKYKWKSYNWATNGKLYCNLPNRYINCNKINNRKKI